MNNWYVPKFRKANFLAVALWQAQQSLQGASDGPDNIPAHVPRSLLLITEKHVTGGEEEEWLYVNLCGLYETAN